MTKPFLFTETTIQATDGAFTNSWELVNLGNSTLMHAAWNPEKSLLVCQFDSIKDNLVPYPVMGKAGKKPTIENRKVEQYYRITIDDKKAVKFILDNLTANYTDQEWDLSYAVAPSELIKEEETIES